MQEIGGVLFFGETFGAHERDRDGVAEDHLDGGGGDRSQIEGAEFSLHWQMHVHVAERGKGIAVNGGDGDEKGVFGLGAGDEAEELLGGAGLAEDDQNVDFGEGVDVVVEGVERGEKAGADAEGDEDLGDLVGDEAGLADAREKI
ncbi:hypothetical protein ACFXTO_025224 [Malus domestica]